MAFCEKCGNALRDGDLFCMHCGTRIINRNPAPAYTGAPTQTQSAPVTPVYTSTPVQPASPTGWTPSAPPAGWNPPAPQPAPEIIPEPVPQPAPEFIPEPVPQPAPEIIPEPAPQPASEFIPEPVPQPAPEIVPEPVPQPAPEFIPEPVPQPAPVPEVAPPPAPKGKIYKVLTHANIGPNGCSNPQLMEYTFNMYALDGWRVISCAISGWGAQQEFTAVLEKDR